MLPTVYGSQICRGDIIRILNRNVYYSHRDVLQQFVHQINIFQFLIGSLMSATCISVQYQTIGDRRMTDTIQCTICIQHNIVPFQILSYLKNEKRLPQPKNCPNSLYDTMLQCWTFDDDKRLLEIYDVKELIGLCH